MFVFECVFVLVCVCVCMFAWCVLRQWKRERASANDDSRVWRMEHSVIHCRG